LEAAASLHSADWPMAMAIASCDLALDNEAVRVAVAFRLALDQCGPMFAIAGRRGATMDLYADKSNEDHNAINFCHQPPWTCMQTNPRMITTPFCHQRVAPARLSSPLEEALYKCLQ